MGRTTRIFITRCPKGMHAMTSANKKGAVIAQCLQKNYAHAVTMNQQIGLQQNQRSTHKIKKLTDAFWQCNSRIE